MDELRYQMMMALNAADLGSPICEQAASICAEIAEQHCSQLHAGQIVEDRQPEPARVRAAR